ncbi:putative GPI-anchored cell wall protein Pst1 [Aspergillus brunneoviolaceus CBS 621.78]|uniref:Uncharacterized protein n=1 Tax=Aspergillus brunneoviolaceus CBS 621.78 TaxID=1450534 RepID=A0ACD1G367_9EURO|nr:hypothetical protein BO95DRAFT_433835 [Aspergillus brunneoviolaceus CBS 621.78]RAH43627.1 hypothetical protein BO95DRAFT_433835 [Aspergillus brunneoviolaceus CBS 621.78]
MIAMQVWPSERAAATSKGEKVSANYKQPIETTDQNSGKIKPQNARLDYNSDELSPKIRDPEILIPFREASPGFHELTGLPNMKAVSVFLYLLCLVSPPVAADSDSNTNCTSSTTITSQADADNRLSSCSTIHGTLTISPSVTGTITLKQLETLNAGLTIQNVSALTAFSAANLETVNGQFSIKNNAQLSTLTLSNLQTVSGELDVEDNSQLRDLVLDDLQYVNGALVLSGKFDRISFSDLKHVNGKTNIRSRGGSFRCSSLDSLRSQDDDDDDDDDHNNNSNSNGVFRGSYSCSDGSNSGLSSGAKAGIAIGVIVLVLLIFLLVWVLMRRNRSRRKRRNAAQDEGKSGYAAVGVGLSHDRKISNMEEKLKPRVSEPHEPEQTINLNNIPRKPLSPPPPSLSTDARRTISTISPSSPPVPAALIPGTESSSSSVPTSDDQNALFLHAIPRRRPSETDVPLLDSGNVHEVPASPVAHRGLYELDAGPVRGTHQQPINHE